MTAAIKSVEAQEFQPVEKKKRAPVKKSESGDSESKAVNVFEGLPTPKDAATQVKSPYPEGVEVFSYQPKDGSEPILLAMNGFEQPDKVWFFDLSELPRLAQTWKWMQQAKIPKSIQRRAQFLPDPEYFAMFDQWFEATRNLNRNGPSGAVTSGK
jgi:hypothetical protein